MQEFGVMIINKVLLVINFMIMYNGVLLAIDEEMAEDMMIMTNYEVHNDFKCNINGNVEEER